MKKFYLADGYDERHHTDESMFQTLKLGKTSREEKGMTEDKMVGWHHRLNGHEFE